ncbi:ABC-F family ATP-binding cassette domain-containing protein [Bryobacter aggregatus]|uniref:ABC-F family ATP-binding cassette domain-containing protein n=1 Tax=Bryobacter aggregatus TaxID=360054 RepID=UPI0004E1D1EC|nr:ABC-F family ATP-binding cassette domain-containing protein [Bryobacter aggregatus]
MALLLSVQLLSKQFGATTLFQNVSLTIEDNQRLGLIGPNGAGKSTMLKILSGQESADSGIVAPRKGLKIATVPQDPVFPEDARVADYLTTDNIWFGLAGFTDAEVLTKSLSGGWKKRLAIAHAASQSPDLLFLDEPTNHLDLEGILWLERSLRQAPFSSVIISHDRQFLENTATHVAELNSVYPDGLFRVEGNYSKFLERREQYFEAERQRKAGLEAVVRRELVWLSRKAKARTRKSQARIDSAHALIGELKEMENREKVSTTTMDFTSSYRQTKRLVETTGLSKSLGGKLLFQDLDIVLVPGIKLGIAGANGSGKSTLLKLLLGSLPADTGEIRRAENLKLVYFDQQREQLDPQATLKVALAPHGDSVIFQGRVIHVNAWAKKFLFDPDQLQQPVHRLSGGERARVLLAQLMLKEADVLFLDEPTNDLDIPTLGVLEESLEEFAGALVLVTHDRYLMDRISTHVLGLDGKGGATLFADYEQYEQDLSAKRAPAAKQKVTTNTQSNASRKKLSYTEQREFDQIEEKIADAEMRLTAKREEADSPTVVSDHIRLQEVYAELHLLESEVDSLYVRWAELTEKTS